MKMIRSMLGFLALASMAFAPISAPADAGVFQIKFRGGRVAAITPANTILPVITGIAREGDTGTCSTGSWSYSPSSYTYARYRDGVTLIGGATAAAYTYVTADVGHTVECAVTATNAAGSATIRSLPTAIIAAASQVLASSQDAQFGELTRVAFGGNPLGYAGSAYLKVTGGTNSCDTKFTFDGAKRLVPINGAGADGTAGPNYSASTCSVTVAEYGSRSGSSFLNYTYSGATGVTGTVNLTIVPNAHSVQQRSTDVSENSELRTVLAHCTNLTNCNASSGYSYLTAGDARRPRSSRAAASRTQTSMPLTARSASAWSSGTITSSSVAPTTARP